MAPLDRTPTNHALEGLRGVAALVILLLHVLLEVGSENTIPHGAVAVDFFFLLSGFVVADAYDTKLASGWAFRSFLTTRLIRLYPLIVLGLSLGAMVYLLKNIISHSHIPLTAFFLNLVTSLLLIPSPIVLDNSWDFIFAFNGVTWSLFFEILVNILYAVIFLWLNERRLMILLAFSGAMIILQIYTFGGVTGGMNWDHIGDHKTYFSVSSTIFGRLPLPIFFPLGAVRVLFPFFCGVWICRRRFVARGDNSGLLSCLALGLVFFAPFSGWVVECTAVIVVMPAIVIFSACSRPGRVLAKCYDWLGRISYPLYLTHYPIVHMFGHVERARALHGPVLVACIGLEIIVCLVVSSLASEYYDRPLRAWLSRRIVDHYE